MCQKRLGKLLKAQPDIGNAISISVVCLGVLPPSNQFAALGGVHIN